MYSILTLFDYEAISPLLILLVGALVLLLVETFAENMARKFSAYFAFITIAVALYAALFAPYSSNPMLTPWLKFDYISRIFTVFFLIIGLGTTMLSSSFFQRFEATRGEYFFLLLASLFGLILIGSAADFLTIFLGIETLSISLYILCCYMKKWDLSHEAAIKYFFMGSLAAAFLLYGIALIYGAVGSTRLDVLLSAYQSVLNHQSKALFLSGAALITLAFAFEAAVVPFHVWAPDVYDGAPTPVTAFMAVGTKVGAFAAFTRVFLDALPHFDEMWNQGVALLAYPTLIYANIVALRQTQFRRFFAYSGISHAGFLLIPLAAETPDAFSALIFYLAVYALATLGCFAVLAFLDKRSEGVMFSDLRGLFYRSPWLAGLFAVCLLTLAGIPPTAGFFAKFYIFKVAFEAQYYGLVIVGLLTTILSAFYYLKIITLMFVHSDAQDREVGHSWPAAVVGALALGAIVFVSCYPAPLLAWLR